MELTADQTDLVAPRLESAVSLRLVTIVVGATVVAWHLASAAALPSHSAGLVAAVAGVTVIQLALTTWLVRAPSRLSFWAGAAGAGAMTLASVFVLSSDGDVLRVIGSILQPLLLVLNLLGATGVRSPRIVSVTTRIALVWAAITVSVLVAGCPHVVQAAPAQGRAAFLCHLV